MESRNTLVLLLVLTLLNACSGGGGGQAPGAPPPVNNPPPAVSKLGGFWSGDMTIDSAQGTEECGALITEDGQFRFLCIFTDLHLAGMSSRNMNTLSGSGLAFSSLGFLDGSFVQDVVVEATLIAETSLTGTWVTAAGDSGSFDMVYDIEYEKLSSLDLLEGVWQGTDELGNPNVTFTIDNLGSFTASNSNGCNSSGMFLLLDSDYNIYQMDSTIVDCSIAGDYSGMALVFEDVVADDSILFSINDDQRAFLVGLERLP